MRVEAMKFAINQVNLPFFMIFQFNSDNFCNFCFYKSFNTFMFGKFNNNKKRMYQARIQTTCEP